MAYLKEDSTFTHVIAIDFGTGASGYGIAPKTNSKPSIEVFNPIDENDDQKTPTAILFDNNQKFIGFGSRALQKYAEICDDDDTAYLFQTYKMAIHKNQTMVKSLDNREMPLKKVVSETLRFIADKALEKLKEQLGGIVKKEKIRWVLTVPALWNEKDKQFMKEAAVEAKIVNQWNSENLFVCLEPEGASIQCREDADESLKNKMKKNTIVLVLDNGGGTNDISIQKLTCEPHENFLSEEVLPSSGGCEWGSKYVDQNFEIFLRNFLGEEIYTNYIQNAIPRLEILKHFEMLKRKFMPGEDERSRLQLSYLSEYLNNKKLVELVNKYNQNKPKDEQLKQKGNSCIDLPPKLMISFFKPLFDKITNKVGELLEETKKKVGYYPKFIFMVGGFSESPFLKNEIKRLFEKNDITVLVPKRPQISVIRGACMYGLNPRLITSRIAKKTYGINTLTTFNPEKHPEEKKVVIEGEDFCEDVFDIFVKKDQSVGIDEQWTKIYCPVRTRQKIMRIIFYCTDETDVEFIDEPGVSKLGELSIDIGKNTRNIEDKTVKVTLRFGETSINATVTNKDSSEEKKCTFNFDFK
jgi:molecular chaperone DnaK (HSP70)